MLLALFVAPLAHAQQLQFVPTVQSSVSTSTPTFMTPGTATTTITYDSFNPGSQIAGIDQGVLLAQLSASTTATTFTFGEEVSQDGIDWYADNTFITTSASTTQTYQINKPTAYSLTFSSTSAAGGPVLANNNQVFRAIHLNFPTRFVRVFVSVTGANGAIWDTILPERQMK